MKARAPRHTDIASTVPWRCDDKDCAERWHKGTYWIELEPFTLALGGSVPERKPPGYTYDAYSDGDHESVDFKDVPDYEEVERLWAEYHADCAATGKDPLGEYVVPRYFERTAAWQVLFQVSVVGVVVKLLRKGSGKDICPCEAPKEVREYLDLVETGKGRDVWVFNAFACENPYATMDRLRRLAESDPEVKVQRTPSHLQLKLKVRVASKEYRKAETVERDIRRVARKAVRERQTP